MLKNSLFIMESVDHIKKVIELNIKSNIDTNKVKSKNVYLKTKYYILENQLESTGKKVKLFYGLSLFFKVLYDRNSSMPLDESLLDREVALFCSLISRMHRTLFYHFFETNKHSDYCRRLSEYSKKYASQLEEIYQKLLAMKEIRTLIKYFSDLVEKEKLVRKKEEKCLSLIKEYELDCQKIDPLKTAKLIDLKKKIESHFNEYKTVYLSNYNLHMENYDETTYEVLQIEIFRKLEFEASEIFQKLIKSFLNTLIEDCSQKVNQLEITLEKIKKFSNSEDNLNQLASLYERITDDHDHTFPSTTSANSSTNYLDEIFEGVLKLKDKTSLDSTIKLFEKE